MNSFIIRNNSSYLAKEGVHTFNYWSLQNKFSIVCPYEFRAGDVLSVVKVDPKSYTIYAAPDTSGVECNSYFAFMSNDIPLSEDDSYEFSFAYCRALLQHEARHNGNKLYTFGLIVDSTPAYVRGYNRAGQRINFAIYLNNS